MRFVIEEPCQHDTYGSHQMPGVDVFEHGDVRCPGGTRRVVEGIPDELVERAASERHRNGRPKCYESFGAEDDGCYCIVNTRAVLEAVFEERTTP